MLPAGPSTDQRRHCVPSPSGLLGGGLRMSKGWMVETTIACDRSGARAIVKRQLFDVAIEDKDDAIDAVRHHTRADACVIIAVVRELHDCYGLSPGRIKARQARIER
jgi:hypothetical protein